MAHHALLASKAFTPAMSMNKPDPVDPMRDVRDFDFRVVTLSQFHFRPSLAHHALLASKAFTPAMSMNKPDPVDPMRDVRDFDFRVVTLS